MRVRSPLLTGFLFALCLHPQAKAETRTDLKHLDANQNGSIELSEFYQTGPEPLHPRMKQVFESLDAKREGKLSFEEFHRAVATVSGNLPVYTPQIEGPDEPISFTVHPKTHRAFVNATVNGVNGTFLIDTGTTHTIIHPEFAKKAGIDFVEICMQVRSGNMGKPGDVISLVRVPELVMGSHHFRQFHAVLHPRTKPNYEFGQPIDGLIGASVLFAKPVVLDFRNQSLKFGKLPESATTTRLTPLKDDFVVTLDAQIDGIHVPLMLDSGAAIGNSILIHQKHHQPFFDLLNNPQATLYQAKVIQVGNYLIYKDLPCHLRTFERSVIGSHFFYQHRIGVDQTAGEIRIERLD